MSWTRRQVLSLFRSQEATAKGPTTKVPVTAERDAEQVWTALLDSGKSHYARDKEELIIRHFFRDRRDGSFIDVGCFLPDKESAFSR